MKTLIIVNLVFGGLILFLKYGPSVIIWLFTLDVRIKRNRARKAAEEAELNAAIAKANFKARMREYKNWH